MAFKYTTTCYPHVLEENPEIVFHLKCRKYVEMIRRCSEIHHRTPTSSNITTDIIPTKSTTNGHTDVFEEDMELYDGDENDPIQIDDGINGDPQREAKEDTHPLRSNDPAKYEELLQEAMSYGQTLMREYRDEKREYRKMLEDIFSLIAYDDAKASVHGHLLERRGRMQVAEELNSAILGKELDLF